LLLPPHVYMNDLAEAPIRVLIVDDEACISDLLAEMLRLLNYAPTQSFSPIAALRLLQDREFDVILSDFRMPQMNGDEFYHKAVADRPELGQRFVFLTGDTMSEETQLFLNEHSRPHLSKPFDLENVIQVISHVIAQQNGALTT
jgi:CheY-like chemotaxis protein